MIDPHDPRVSKATGDETVGPGEAARDATAADAAHDHFATAHWGGNEPAANPADADVAPLDTIIGEYEILGEIDRGGMGIVYRARHRKLGRIVALKMVLAGKYLSDADRARFFTEAESAAALDHPGIVPIYEIDNYQGSPYFTMAYVSGGSLAQRVKERPLHPREAARVLIAVAEAVEYAHSRGVIHRDIKPQNILFDESGQPKVTDFGLAKRVGQDAHLTATGEVLGTPSYMSPEQALGRQAEIGPAVDIYALGAVLYHLLTGRPPFQAATLLDTLYQVTSNEPVALRSLNPNVPPDLDTIALKCLSKGISKRYARAADVAADLRRWLAGEPIQARPTGPIERLCRWAYRHPAVASLSATLLAAIITALVIVSVLYDTARRLATDEKRSRIEAETARTDAQEQARVAREQANLAKHQTTIVTLEQGLAYCREGDVPGGLLRMINALENASPDAEPLVRVEISGWRMTLVPLENMVDPGAEVQAMRLTRDGRSIWSGTAAGGVQRWNARTGAAEGATMKHLGPIYKIALSPDEKYVATASGDHFARIWDAATGAALCEPLAHPDLVCDVAFSPDGLHIATACGDGGVRFFKVPDGTPDGPMIRHDQLVRSVDFSPHGERIATASWDGTARMWQATGEHLPIGSPMEHEDRCRGARFSPDGKYLATTSWDKTARLWDGATGAAVGQNMLHEALVSMATFSADGTMLATSSEDGTARIWAVPSGKPIGRPMEHRGWVFDLAFNPSGDRLVTGGGDNTARIWEIPQCRPAAAPLRHRGSVLSVAYAPDGQTVMTGSQDARLRVWDARRTPLVPTRTSHPGMLFAMSFVGHSDRLRIVASDRVQPWRFALVPGIEIPSDRGAVSLLSREFHVPSQPGGAFRGPLPIGTEMPHTKSVFAAAVSSDGQRLVTGGASHIAHVWNLNDSSQVGRPMVHGDNVIAVAFSGNGKRVATADALGVARVWDADSGRPISIELIHAEAVCAIALNDDGSLLATGSDDGFGRIWSVDTAKLVGQPVEHQGDVRTVAFSSDATWFATGSEDNTAQVWETATGKPFGVLLEHDNSVVSVAFRNDSRILVTGSLDGYVQVWSVLAGLPLGPPLNADGISHSLAFSPTERQLICGGAATIGVWHFPEIVTAKPSELRTEMEACVGFDFSTSGSMRLLEPAEWRKRLSAVAPKADR